MRIESKILADGDTDSPKDMTFIFQWRMYFMPEEAKDDFYKYQLLQRDIEKLIREGVDRIKGGGPR